jgi:hypothetical protein
MKSIPRALCATALVAACTGTGLTPASPTSESHSEPKPDPAPELVWTLPPGQATTVGASDSIVLRTVHVAEQSCTMDAPPLLGLLPGVDRNALWTVNPSAPGRYPIRATCSGAKGQTASVSDTLSVYPQPEATWSAPDAVSLMVEDSLDLDYDSVNTVGVLVSCRRCGDSTGTTGPSRLPAHLTRIGPNRVRFYNAENIEPDSTSRRGVCVTAVSLDRRFRRTRCATVISTARPLSIPDSIRRAELTPLHRILVETYDQSGQSVHPDIMRFPVAWAGWECWMVFTPYAGSNGALENPSLAVSHDCQNWHNAPGVKAPLVDKPENGYNSDPELSFNAARGCLSVIFREVTDRNTIKATESCDGKTWSAPGVLFALPNHQAISPTVTDGPDGRKMMLYVDAGAAGCGAPSSRIMLRRATGGAASGASQDFQGDEEINLSQPGGVIWHIKWRYIPSKKEYWMIYPAYRVSAGTCIVNDLFFATSSNGKDWQSFPIALLNRLDPRFNFLGLYRATFWYDPDADVLETVTSAYEGGKWGEFGFSSSFSKLDRALASSLTAPVAALVATSRPLRRDTRPPGTLRIPIEDRVRW